MKNQLVVVFCFIAFFAMVSTLEAGQSETLEGVPHQEEISIFRQKRDQCTLKSDTCREYCRIVELIRNGRCSQHHITELNNCGFACRCDFY